MSQALPEEERMAAGVVRDLDRRRAQTRGGENPNMGSTPDLNDGDRRLIPALNALERTAKALGELFGDGVRLRLGVIHNGIAQAATDARELRTRESAEAADRAATYSAALYSELLAARADALAFAIQIDSRPRIKWPRGLAAQARKTIMAAEDREEF